jgi:peptide/nickel transport system substrate-binding protein
VVERNPDYWRGAPKLERVIIKSIPDEATRVIRLQKGEVNVITDVFPEFVPFITADENLQIQSHPGLHTWWIAMNTKETPLQDRRVRQALNYAVDKERIIEEILKGEAELSKSFVWPGTWAYEPNVGEYPYNPDRARELLAEAGYPEGFSTQFILPVSGSMMVAPRELATVVQANLRDVGVEAAIQALEWNSYLGALLDQSVPYGLAEMAWGSNADDPGQYCDLQLMTKYQPPAGWNISNFSNTQVDELLSEASSTVDQEQRKQLYQEAQRIVSEEAPWIFMFHANYVVASRKQVQGLVVGGNFNRLGLLQASVSES